MDNLIVTNRNNSILNRIPSDACTACIGGGQCKQDRIIEKVDDSNFRYYICFKSIKNRKHARYLIQYLPDTLQTVHNLSEKREEIIDNAKDVVVHNTKNLLAQLNAKYEKYRYYGTQKTFQEKVLIIEEKIDSDKSAFITDFFNIGKIITQLQNEYSIIDLLQTSTPFLENRRVGYEIHKILLETFYHYEDEFNERGISFDFGGRNDIHYKINIEYRSIKTALSQFFDNTIKYAKPNEKIFVEFYESLDSLSVKFYMKSLYLSDKDLTSIYEAGVRGEYALSSSIPGQGYGFYIINHLLALNDANIKVTRENDIRIKVEYDKRIFSKNIFEFTFPLSK